MWAEPTLHASQQEVSQDLANQKAGALRIKLQSTPPIRGLFRKLNQCQDSANHRVEQFPQPLTARKCSFSILLS